MQFLYLSPALRPLCFIFNLSVYTLRFYTQMQNICKLLFFFSSSSKFENENGKQIDETEMCERCLNLQSTVFGENGNCFKQFINVVLIEVLNK